MATTLFNLIGLGDDGKLEKPYPGKEEAALSKPWLLPPSLRNMGKRKPIEIEEDEHQIVANHRTHDYLWRYDGLYLRTAWSRVVLSRLDVDLLTMGARETPIQSAILELLQWKGFLHGAARPSPFPSAAATRSSASAPQTKRRLASPTSSAATRAVSSASRSSAKGVLSDGQKRWRDNILKAGGAWTCARSTEEAEQFLKETFGV